MMLAGLWHGAHANFLFWGFWHAVGLIIFKTWRELKGGWDIPRPISWLLTTCWILAGWMLFRGHSIDDLYRYATALTNADSPPWIKFYISKLLILCLPLALFQMWQYKTSALIPFRVTRYNRPLIQGALLAVILVMAQREELKPFIYFQF
jgi:D-alanyl-lipoteichoic acid acyltransferase DltB (MBOAT superfamily)